MFRSAADGPPEDLGFEYAVRRSSRAKNIRINVDREGVVLVVPERASMRQGHDFIVERADWIRGSLERFERDHEAVVSRELADGEEVPLLGAGLLLRVMEGPSGRVHRNGDVLRVHVPDDRRETVAAALERWYRREAKAECAARLDAVVARNGTEYERVSIRDQKTRWGSCSSSGTISFNWRLLLAPEAVLDYVVEHEAAHIEVRDHSRRFWALMDARVPDWRDHRRWLSQYGGTLRLI